MQKVPGAYESFKAFADSIGKACADAPLRRHAS